LSLFIQECKYTVIDNNNKNDDNNNNRPIIRLLSTAVTKATGYIKQKKLEHTIMLR